MDKKIQDQPVYIVEITKVCANMKEAQAHIAEEDPDRYEDHGLIQGHMNCIKLETHVVLQDFEDESEDEPEDS